MTFNARLTDLTCGVCHVEFAIPTSLHDKAYHNHAIGFWCPMGHKVFFQGDSPLVLEQRRRQRLEQENARLAEEARNAADAERLARLRADRAKKSLARHKTRASAGVCPCCTRTFSNMARHMKTKHPDYNVVHLKGRVAA